MHFMNKLVVACLLFALLIPVSLFAQSAGTVRGEVKDQQGAAVPDAKVVLTNVATNTSSESVTNSDGLFVFGYVPPAKYELSIKKNGFRTSSSSRFSVEVAQVVNLTFTLEIGNISETITVVESSVAINTTSGELGHEVDEKQLMTMPLLNRDYYNLMQLTPGAVDTGSTTGDTRGRGLAIGGARTSQVNFMLDGGENNDTFVAGVAQNVPLDAVQEFRVQTNNATSEYGRNPVVTNVVTKSGANAYHGSAYEFYRGAALSTTPFNDKANLLPKSNFVRNQFGASFGGAIIKDKLFYFGSFEGQRIRSGGNAQFYVPVDGFTANATANVNSYLQTYGGVPKSDCSLSPISSNYIWNTSEGNAGALQSGQSTGGATMDYGNASVATPGNVFGIFPTGTTLAADGSGPAASLIPTGTNMFCRASIKVPVDAGGGVPGDTWLATGRVDYTFSSNTSFFARYAYANTTNPVGAGSASPYSQFNTGASNKDQNVSATLQHSFAPTFFGELRGTYNRVNPQTPLGAAPPTAPCWQYSQAGQTPTGDSITFPGYLPTQCSFNGLDSGGPQNVYQGAGSLTKLTGKHTLKFGGNVFHMRFNHRFGAFENGYYESESMQAMLAGDIGFLEQAIDPRGHVPGEKYSTATDGAFQFPSFIRHYHYNEFAFYGQDTYKLTNKFTVTYGLRWEYFGVQHSPAGEQYLDANLYLNAIGTPSKNTFIAVSNARFRRTNQFYRPDYSDFGPRLGFAYDFSGSGRTVLRAGYGMYYDRNFGNATYNAIQNPPNYNVLANTSSAIFGQDLTIAPNQFDILSAAAGGSFTVSGSARMLDNNLKTPRIQQWNATLEHNFFGKGILGSISYMGTKGDHLYSLNNLNQRGSCLLLITVEPTAACNPAGGNSSRINQSGLSGMNRRGSEGLSRYNALALDLHTQEIAHTGVTLFSTYTWSHSIDNESSFFADSSFEGNWGFGFKDPYAPSLDRASSSNDIRNRFTLAVNWAVPFMRSQQGFVGHVLGGWNISDIYTAQTGAAFTVYDGSTGSQCHLSGPTNFCYPVLTGTGKVPGMTSTPSGPNAFTLYDLSTAPYQTQDQFCAANTLNTALGPLGGRGCTAALINLYPNLMASRNNFRTPGIWNMDLALAKDIRLPKEGHNLQFRADFLNFFNHSNLYADPATNLFAGPGSAVVAHRGVSNALILERRNIQLSLRYSF